MGWKQEQIDKLLDQYLDGKLTEEEVRLMHETLERGGILTDAELDKIVLPVDILQPSTLQKDNIQQNTKTTNTYHKLEDFKQFRNYHHPIVETSKAYSLVFIIVFFTILVMAPFVYMLLPIHFNAKQTFNNNFSPYPINNIERDFNNNESAISNWEKGVAAYKQGNYHSAVHILEDLSKNTDDNSQAYIDHFYIGISYLVEKEPKAAIDQLKQVLESQANSEWKAHANWYLALSYLQLNETQNTINYLKEIVANGDNTYHYDEAMKLLEEI
ncbi:MAG: hypothetical protein R3E32_01090 [Chitinophagales bacterium]